jgi:uncharacterized protein (TIGR03067 family)
VNPRYMTVFVVAILLAADSPKEDQAKKDLDALQGTWRVTAAERDGGMKVPEDEMKKITLVFKGDKLTARRTENAQKPEEKLYEMSFTLDPSQKPKWIDVTYTDGERKGESSQGIYELSGDTLKICMNRGNTRPTEFETKPETQRHMLTLTRQKGK